MARIQTKEIWWTPVGDAVKYNVYVAKAIDVAAVFSYSLPHISTEAPVVLAPTDFPSSAFDEEEDYNVWVTALDAAGNESSPLLLQGFFDFIPPLAPADGGIRDYLMVSVNG